MIGAIEEAIADRLRAANEAGLFGGYLRTIATYGGALSDTSARALTARGYPALLVTFGGETITQHLRGGSDWRAEARYLVYALARATRSEAAARLAAGPDEVGSYQLAEDARRILIGWTPPLASVSYLSPVGIELIESRAEDAAICAVELVCQYDVTAAPAAGDTVDDLRHIHLDWDLPPLGQVRPPLPSAAAEARSDIRFREGS